MIKKFCLSQRTWLALQGIIIFCSLTVARADVLSVMVPMQDGVRLFTKIYRPSGNGPWPTILVRTPYPLEDLASLGSTFNQFGIVVVVQSMRGRYASEGVFQGFFEEKADGKSTIDWTLGNALQARQPWSNGKIMTTGSSAAAIAEYLDAPEAQPGYRCQWAENGTSDLYASMYPNGAYRSELFDGWAHAIDEPQILQRWRNPLNSGYWNPVRISDFSSVRTLGVHLGGWYDIFARETIVSFLNRQNKGGVTDAVNGYIGAKGRQKLIMGPWTHALNPTRTGEVSFPNTALDEWRNALAYQVDACLLDGSFGLATIDSFNTLLAPVNFYTMGAVGEPGAPGNKWYAASTWPPPGTTNSPLYLVSRRLTMTAPSGLGGNERITYDPKNPSPTICGANLLTDSRGGDMEFSSGMCDQGPVERRTDKVLFTTPVLRTPVEVTGDLRAELWITADVPDTDISVRLTDVYPDGRSMLVLDNAMRARYHASPEFSKFQFLQPGVPVKLTFDLGPTSIVFNAGHRIRVIIIGSNAPRFMPNPNTGAAFFKVGDPTRIAHINLLHDVTHPSRIIFPHPVGFTFSAALSQIIPREIDIK